MGSVEGEVGLLNGPYPVIECDYWTRSRTPGVFVLENRARKPALVGVSDLDVRAEILIAANRIEAVSFFVEYIQSGLRRALTSAALFHTLGLARLQDHPPVAKELGYCPVPGCALGHPPAQP